MKLGIFAAHYLVIQSKRSTALELTEDDHLAKEGIKSEVQRVQELCKKISSDVQHCATLYALEDYRQALSDFYSMCDKISKEPESSCSKAAISTMEKLDIAMGMCSYFLLLLLTSQCRLIGLGKFAIDFIATQEPTLDQQNLMEDLLLVQRDLGLVIEFLDHYRERGWTFSYDRKGGYIKIFEGEDEVCFKEDGGYTLKC
jgi:Fe2+ transport system protein B